jgi:hypothetical protein
LVFAVEGELKWECGVTATAKAGEWRAVVVVRSDGLKEED